MAVIFYLIGWICILIGVGTAGYNVFTDIQGIMAANGGASPLSDIVKYLPDSGLLRAAPGLTTAFSGLLLLAVGGVLSRLSEIAYNTRTG